MSDILFYGIDESGRARVCERLLTPQRSALEELARERLLDWPAVEIWHGPWCIVRMQRDDEEQGAGSIGRLSR